MSAWTGAPRLLSAETHAALSRQRGMFRQGFSRQDWTAGQLVQRHGSPERAVTCGPHGDQRRTSVGPKSATVETPNAAARWVSPES